MMDEKILAIICIAVLTAGCFIGIGYLGTVAAIDVAIVSNIVDVFKFAVASLGSLATGVAIGEYRAKKKLEE